MGAIFGRLQVKELSQFREVLTESELLHEGLSNHFMSLPADAQPMAILSAMISMMVCYRKDFGSRR